MTRIGLVGCVKQKRHTAALAKDLYTSTLFTGRRRWVEQTCDRWFILSAAHGLIDPDRVLEPYDVTLKNASSADRRRWSTDVLAELDRRVASMEGVEFEIHAGKEYRVFGLASGLVRLGAHVTVPAEGLVFGKQLTFYGAGPGVSRPEQAGQVEPAGPPSV
jgi:hypothetical protein